MVPQWQAHLLAGCKLLGQVSESVQASHMERCPCSSEVPKHIQGPCKVPGWQQQLQGLLGCCDALQDLQRAPASHLREQAHTADRSQSQETRLA